jgi:two-component system phosphate regulon response regulator PhoB
MSKLIHIVEDDEDIRFVIVYILSENGYNVAESGTAREFSLYIQTGRPDLILMDVMLPDGNGIELCRNLKINPHTSSIPIVIMSAHAAEQSVLAEACAEDFISKPFDLNHFLAVIRKQLPE